MDGGSSCKACGANLPLPDREGRAACLSCGRIARVAASPPPAPSAPKPSATGTAGSTPSGPFTTWTPSPGESQPSPAVRKGVGCASFGCLVWIVLSVAGIIAATVLVRSVSDDVRSSIDQGLGFSSSLHPSGSTALPLTGTAGVALDGGDTQPVEVATAVYDASDDTRHLARVRLGAADDAVVWRTDPLPPDVYEAPLALTGDTLFAGVADEVWALSATSGAVAWKASLPDVVRPGCPDCFVQSGDTLLVRTADAQILAFGPASGEPRWSRRLASVSGRFLVTGAGLVVIDHPVDRPGEMQVLVLDPATGATVSTYRPTCDDGSGTRDFNFTDQVYAVPGGPDLVATVSFGGGCAVRWNGATGQVVWSGPVGNGNSLDQEPGLVAGDRLFLPASTGLISVDLASGGWVEWAAPPDTVVRPLARHGSVLVTASATTRGTARHGLVGWDIASGQVRWQSALPGDGELLEVDAGSSDALFSGTPRAVLVSEGDHLAVATFDGDARTISVETIDPANGTRGAAVVSEFRSGSGTPSVRVLQARPTGLLLSLDGIVFVGPDGAVSLWPA